MCTPKEPHCIVCPVVTLCEAAKRGLQARIPTPKIKEKIEEREEIAVLVRKKGKNLLIRYPSGVRWAGLWDFPRCTLDKTAPQQLSSLTGRKIVVGKLIQTLKHSVTRYRITLEFHEAQEFGKIVGDSTPYETKWATNWEMEQIPLHSTARKLWNNWKKTT
jgi:A/G-specific adenine glycosylase